MKVEYTNLDDFVMRLDNVRKTGHSYRAACPVHNGKDRNLLVNMKNGEVFAHCFVCHANTFEVAKELGVKGDNINQLPIPRYSKDQRTFDRYMIEICEKEGLDNMRYSDRKKYRECKMRMDNFNNKMKEYMNN
jgi:hypothetical protein